MDDDEDALRRLLNDPTRLRASDYDTTSIRTI